MASGFDRVKYESENAGIIFVEISPEVVAVAGTPPTDPANSSLTAYTSVSRRRNGIHARLAVLTRDRGTGADSFTDTKTIPVLTLADFAAAGFQPGATITIGTVAWKVRRLIPEEAI